MKEFWGGFWDGISMAGFWGQPLNRRIFLKQVSATAVAGAVAPTVLSETERGYDSATISIRMVEEAPGITSLMLFEHGDADYCIIEAYYWREAEIAGAQRRIMLHEETTSDLVKDAGCLATVRVPVADIVFLRVKELTLLRLNEFGKKPDGH